MSERKSFTTVWLSYRTNTYQQQETNLEMVERFKGNLMLLPLRRCTEILCKPSNWFIRCPHLIKIPEDTGKILNRFGASPTFIYGKQGAGWNSNALAAVHFFKLSVNKISNGL